MSKAVIRSVQSGEEDRALAVQVSAFVRDPTMRWIYPEAHAYCAHFAGFSRAFGGRAFEHGTAYVSEDFAACALWLPVGVHVDGDGFESFARATVHESFHDDFFALLDQMDEHHTPEPHWYLAVLGVDAAHQGRGIGADIMQHALERVDAEHRAAYLESSNPANIPFYERHGFEAVGRIQAGASPVVTPMIRPAR